MEYLACLSCCVYACWVPSIACSTLQGATLFVASPPKVRVLPAAVLAALVEAVLSCPALPPQWRVFTDMGRELVQQGRHGEAERYFKKVRALHGLEGRQGHALLCPAVRPMRSSWHWALPSLC